MCFIRTCSGIIVYSIYSNRINIDRRKIISGIRCKLIVVAIQYYCLHRRIFSVPGPGLYHMERRIGRIHGKFWGCPDVLYIQLCAMLWHFKRISPTGLIRHILRISVLIRIGWWLYAARLIFIRYHLINASICILGCGRYMDRFSRSDSSRTIFIDDPVKTVGTSRICRKSSHILIKCAIGICHIYTTNRQ